MLKQKTTKEKRKTGKRVQNTPANGGIVDGESCEERMSCRRCHVLWDLGAVTDTGHPLQISLLGRLHVGHSLVLDKLLY